MIRQPDVDPTALAAYNAGVRRAVAANAADPFAHLTPRRMCACGARTRSDDAVCRRCRQSKGDT